MSAQHALVVPRTSLKTRFENVLSRADPRRCGGASRRSPCPQNRGSAVLSGLCHRRLPGKRRDLQRGDAIAMLARDPEAEAVEGEGLARLGDRARLVDDE